MWPLPRPPRNPAPRPEKILLFHDASESAIDTDPAVALDLIDAWFATLPAINVELRHLLEGDAIQPGRLVRVIGQWPDGPMPDVEITFASGTHTRTITTAKPWRGQESDIIRRLHAQRQLAALARAIDHEGDTPLNLIATNQLQSKKPLLDADIRIVIQTTDTARLPDISIVDPLGHTASMHRPGTSTGGSLTIAPGLAEFTIRRAIPGTYTVHAQSPVDATLRITVHTDWARPAHKATHETQHLPATNSPTRLAAVEWRFRAGK